MLRQDRPRDGGVRTWGHCEDCRVLTSPWDDEYIRWADQIAAVLVTSARRGERSQIIGNFATARPGRFARAALAGMTALAEGLVITHPELVAAIRGVAPSPDRCDMRFLMGVTPVSERIYVGGGHGGVVVSMSVGGVTGSGEDQSSPTISAISHFPPFSLLFVDHRAATQFPHVDCTSWLDYGVEEAVEDFPLALPAVRLRVGEGLATTPDAFTAARV